MKKGINFLFFVSCSLSLATGCASSQISQLETQNEKLQNEVQQLSTDLDKLNEARAQAMREAEKTRANREPPEGYPPVDAFVSPLVPPPYVGFTEQPPMYWGEAGSGGRSVRFTNDWSPYQRYYLRIFLDGEEGGLTDGVGVFQAQIKGVNHPVSLLRPNGQAKHVVDVGEHHILVEKVACIGYSCQYVETCEWHENFDGNLGLNNEWHFWGGRCHKSQPSN